ncbi:hypothetical protein FRC03_008075, partial [Tulasnella sp. 419]
MHAESRRLGIEENIGKDMVERLNEQSMIMGGEQYRPDKEKIAYPSRKTALKMLQEEETKGLDDARVPIEERSTVVSLVQFVNDALDIEIEQIKYCELVRQHGASTKPEHINRLASTKKRLGTRLNKHYEMANILAPKVAPRAMFGDGPHKDPIILASRYSVAERAAFQLEEM